MGVVDGGPKGFGNARAHLDRIKANMADLSQRDDPWTEEGYDLPKKLKDPFRKLREASDEAETRLAWMEHIADAGDCPVCSSSLGMVERKDGPQLQCSQQPSHLSWP